MEHTSFYLHIHSLTHKKTHKQHWKKVFNLQPLRTSRNLAQHKIKIIGYKSNFEHYQSFLLCDKMCIIMLLKIVITIGGFQSSPNIFGIFVRENCSLPISVQCVILSINSCYNTSKFKQVSIVCISYVLFICLKNLFFYNWQLRVGSTQPILSIAFRACIPTTKS